MSCCSSKKTPRKKHIEHKILISRYQFTPKEIESYKQKFERISSSNGFTKENFRQHMSLMETKVLPSISDRIFAVMNKNKSGTVNLEEYLSYLDIMLYGSLEEKAMQSFSIISGPENSEISYKTFKKWLISVEQMKSTITGKSFSMKESDVQDYFNSIDVKSDNIIDFEEYSTAISQNLNFLELVNTLNYGMAETFNVPNIEVFAQEINYTETLVSLENKISKIVDIIEEQTGIHLNAPLNPNDIFLNVRNSDTGFYSYRHMNHDLGDSPRRKTLMLTARAGRPSKLAGETKLDLVKEKLVMLLEKLNKIRVKGVVEDEEENNFRRTWTKSIPRNSEPVKRNDVIYWGDDDWNLILNMMLGIQKSVKSTVTGSEIDSEVKPEMFTEKIKHRLLPTHSRSNKTFKFRDYAPTIFERIRNLYRIKANDYIRSLGMEKMMHALMANEFSSLTGQCTTGKSGSFFYYSDDGKYMLKTLSEEEYIFFRGFIADYYFHLYKNPHTMITRFFGFHKIIVSSSRKKLYFIIMGNLFKNEYELDVKYDLKGSTLGRVTKDNEDKTIARKDNNFNSEGRKIQIGNKRKGYLMEQIEKDVDLMRRCKVIDYSLLLGIAIVEGKHVSRQQGFAIFTEVDDGGMLSEDRSQLYFMGIIDILTYYGTRKKLEHFFKKSIHKKKDVSCAPPDFYAERFLEYMNSIIE